MPKTHFLFSGSPSKFWGLILGIVLSISVALFAELEPGKPAITNTLAIAVLMAVWWVTEAVPIAITALIPVVAFPLLNVMDGKEVSAAYFNHIIFLFIGGFIMALAMEKWNLHKRIALKILIAFGISPARILLGFMVATGFLSMWMSNTATTMMMVPIVLSIINKLEENIGKKEVSRYAIGLFLGVAYSASIGGIATLVGTPPNLAFIKIFEIMFPTAPDISFARWFIFALPISLSMFIAAFFVLFFMYKPQKKWKNLTSQTFKTQLKTLGKASYEEKVVLILFLALAFLWIFRSGITFDNFIIPGWSQLLKNPDYFNDGTVAILISLILFIIPSKQQKGQRIMNWKMANRLPWHIVLLFGGGFALAQGFENSGLSLWIGQQLYWLKNIHPLFIIIGIALAMSFLTELTSNIATTQMLLPVFASMSISSGLNPLLLMIPATLAASLAFMLPIATPPNAIIFGTNRLSIPQMARTGFSLNFTGVLIVTLLTYWLGLYLFDIDIQNLPFWAQKNAL